MVTYVCLACASRYRATRESGLRHCPKCGGSSRPTVPDGPPKVPEGMSYITEETIRTICIEVLPHVDGWLKTAKDDFPQMFKGIVAHCLAAVAMAKVGNFHPDEVMQIVIDFTASFQVKR